MGPNRRTLAIPLLLALWTFPAAAAEVRDDAKMFDPAAVEKARETISRAESQTKIPVVIETVGSLGGEKIDDVAVRLARRSGTRGVFVLISKAEHKLEVRDYKSFLGPDGRRRIRDAFLGPFKSGDFDTGLIRGADAISDVLATATPPSEAAPAPARRDAAGAPIPRPAQRSSGLPGWLVIGLILVAVFIGIRLLRSLFGGGGGYARPVGGPGMGGYGGGGYGGGGGGGGFMSSLFGGIGGAMAGNWIYDQMSGRHRGEGSYGPTSADPGAAPPDTGAAGSDWGGAGESADWGGGGGDGGGGGGDWGGGGGGDWGGGGGGDWGGGGGGDGGGGGGGDW